MTTYARTAHSPLADGDTALELFTPPDDVAIDECFHPSLVPFFHEVPDDTLVNATWDGTTWVAP